jgi:hypothetical protein
MARVIDETDYCGLDLREPNWQPIATMPNGVPVLTRILDGNGERNVQVLTLRGRLYWSGAMYVYYQPTHWAYPKEQQP